MLSVWTEFNCDKSLNDRIAKGASRSRRRRVTSDEEIEEEEDDVEEVEVMGSSSKPDYDNYGKERRGNCEMVGRRIATPNKKKNVKSTSFSSPLVDETEPTNESVNRISSSLQGHPSTSKHMHSSSPRTSSKNSATTKKRASTSTFPATTTTSAKYPHTICLSSDDENLAYLNSQDHSEARHRDHKMKSKNQSRERSSRYYAMLKFILTFKYFFLSNIYFMFYV